MSAKRLRKGDKDGPGSCSPHPTCNYAMHPLPLSHFPHQSTPQMQYLSLWGSAELRVNWDICAHPSPLADKRRYALGKQPCKLFFCSTFWEILQKQNLVWRKILVWHLDVGRLVAGRAAAPSTVQFIFKKNTAGIKIDSLLPSASP